MRYQSYILADELRQSSDDLTRLARTYVVTGDASYERQYMDILDIRGGKKPRPLNYERIYWDFVAAGQASPRGTGETISLTDLMKKAGYSDAGIRQAEGSAGQLERAGQDRSDRHERGQGPVRRRQRQVRAGRGVPTWKWRASWCTAPTITSTRRRS